MERVKEAFLDGPYQPIAGCMSLDAIVHQNIRQWKGREGAELTAADETSLAETMQQMLLDFMHTVSTMPASEVSRLWWAEVEKMRRTG